MNIIKNNIRNQIIIFLFILLIVSIPIVIMGKGNLDRSMQEFYDKFSNHSVHVYKMDDAKTSMIPSYDRGDLFLCPDSTFHFGKLRGSWKEIGDSVVLLKSEKYLDRMIEVEREGDGGKVYIYDSYGKPIGYDNGPPFSRKSEFGYLDCDQADVELSILLSNGDTIEAERAIYHLENNVLLKFRYTLPPDAVGFIVDSSSQDKRTYMVERDERGKIKKDYILFIPKGRNLENLSLRKSGNKLAYPLSDGTVIEDFLIEDENVLLLSVSGMRMWLYRDGRYAYGYRNWNNPIRGTWRIDEFGRLLLVPNDGEKYIFYDLVYLVYGLEIKGIDSGESFYPVEEDHSVLLKLNRVNL